MTRANIFLILLLSLFITIIYNLNALYLHQL